MLNKLFTKKCCNIIYFVILSIITALLTTTFFVAIMEVKKIVSTMITDYRMETYFEYITTYQTQCHMVPNIYGGGYTYQCRPFPVLTMVPRYRMVPVFRYVTSFFSNDIYLQNLWLSNFGIGGSRLFLIIPIFVLLTIGSSLIFLKKKLFTHISSITLDFYAFILVGSLIHMIRLKIMNPTATKFALGFYFLVIATLLILILTIYRKIYLLKSTAYFTANQTNMIKHKFNVSFVFRMLVLGLLVIVSETFIVSIYGFILGAFMITGIYISMNKKLRYKIIGLVFSFGLLVNSIVTLIISLVRDFGKLKFLQIVPIDNIIFRVIDICVFVLMMITLISELKYIRAQKKDGIIVEI